MTAYRKNNGNHQSKRKNAFNRTVLFFQSKCGIVQVITISPAWSVPKSFNINLVRNK